MVVNGENPSSFNRMSPINHNQMLLLKDISFFISFIVGLTMVNWRHPIFCLFYENLMKIKMIININKKIDNDKRYRNE